MERETCDSVDFYMTLEEIVFLQKQPPGVFCKKRCSYKFRNIHRKASVPESLF